MLIVTAAHDMFDALSAAPLEASAEDSKQANVDELSGVTEGAWKSWNEM